MATSGFSQPGMLPSDMDPNLRSAIQALRAQTNELKADLDKAKADIVALTARVYALEHP